MRAVETTRARAVRVLSAAFAPDEEQSAAVHDESWQRIRRHFGTAHTGDPNGSDNDRIDADLAKEYGRL